MVGALNLLPLHYHFQNDFGAIYSPSQHAQGMQLPYAATYSSVETGK
jgi:hypothetical protein